MIIQIQGNVKFQISLDSTTWIFDDRKVTLDEALTSEGDTEEILFSDDKEWNRQIIEGTTKPPTLKSEKKFKKQDLLEKTFVMNLATFLEYAEPERGEDAMITFTHDDGTTLLPYNERDRYFAQFSKEGKRMYEDNMVDVLVINDGELIERLIHVTGIKID